MPQCLGEGCHRGNLRWGLFWVISEATGRVFGPTEGETVATKSHFQTLGLPREGEEMEGSPPWLGCYSPSVLSPDQEGPAWGLAQDGETEPRPGSLVRADIIGAP